MTTLVSKELQQLLRDDKAIEELYSKIINKENNEFKISSNTTNQFDVRLHQRENKKCK